jgi:hypothetical protein
MILLRYTAFENKLRSASISADLCLAGGPINAQASSELLELFDSELMPNKESEKMDGSSGPSLSVELLSDKPWVQSILNLVG